MRLALHVGEVFLSTRSHRSIAANVSVQKLIRSRKDAIHTVPGVSQLANETAKPIWDRIEGYLGKGLIVPPRYDIVKGWSADAVNAALDRYRDGGKVYKTRFEVSL